MLSRVTRRILASVAMGALAVTLTATPLIAGSAVALGAEASPPLPGDTYRAMDPVRLLDTRDGNGLNGKLLANVPATFQITGRGGIPTNAAAVTGNVTVVNPTNSWAVYLGPSPLAYPQSSTINFGSGAVAGNGLTVALGPGGTLSATYMSTPNNTTDLVFDVTGYFTPDAGGTTYHPMSPARLLDTRAANGLNGKLLANVPATFQVAGRAGIPGDATAVTGNVTAVNETNSWAVFLGPNPSTSPSTSTINFGAGQTQGNNLTVALGPGGTLSATYMSTSGNTTDLVFDVTGYYTADTTGSVYVPVTPKRLLDTRAANGLNGTLAANVPATFQVGGRGGIPTYATALSGNVTVVNETGSWAVFVGPSPAPNPSTSTINFSIGDTKGNGLTVAQGPGGALSATYMSTGGNTTDLVIDVTGYFVPTSGQPPTWDLDLFDPRAPRYQNPDLVACAAAAAQSMLNTIAYDGSDPHLSWQPTTSFATQETILAFERANMTMLVGPPGTDPHGWRNALNYYGWGSLSAGVYRDSAYTSLEAAAKATVLAVARYHKPVGILARYGNHAQFVTGYEVIGDDPSTGSSNFTVVGVDLTDPWAAVGHRDFWISYADWSSGGSWVRFSPYTQNDSPYRDPIDGRIGYAEWYGNWIIIDPTQ